MGIVDAIVDLVSRGTTLGENNLKEIAGGVILQIQMASNNTYSQSINQRYIRESQKLSGENFLNWEKNLRIVVDCERKLYILETDPPKTPKANAHAFELTSFKKYEDDARDVKCIIMASMTAELQRLHADMEARLMIQCLRDLLQGHPKNSGIYVIEVNMPDITSWVMDTGCGSHICTSMQNLHEVRHLTEGEVQLKVYAHWTAVKNILKYLRNTNDAFLVYGGEEELKVVGYTDASFQTDRDDYKSQAGYVFCLNGGAFSWKSSKQDTTADSIKEAEYMAAAEAAKEDALILQTSHANMGPKFMNEKGLNHVTFSTPDGALKATPAMGIVDAIVDLVSSGTTLGENNLKEIAGGVILQIQEITIKDAV
ncbi:unnamed protein product [Cuscuta campestris]|uniref:ATP phosphoribosyltransferase n=1 Tax=Cuscuta campestris TaxID=132261 RepID=A0A484MB15_9ASTE|nr:unnamed protein product [Cuscuta campestris]